MKYNLILFITIFCLGYAEDHVSNVVAAQRTDGSKIVDISYDLAADPFFPSYAILLEVSSDGGTTYSPTSLRCTGDIGPNIFAGSRSIEWDLTAEYTELELDQMKVKVIAVGHEVLANLPFEMVNVPAGDYTYGESIEIRNIAYDYQVSTYEITNAQYAAFLIYSYAEGSVWIMGEFGEFVMGWYSGNEQNSPGNYNFYNLGSNTGPNNYGRIDWNGNTFVVPEGYGDHPVIEVSWYGAVAFARYYGLRLPDEYEWEKAARGNTGYNYPFGNSINGSQANYLNNGDPWDNGTTPVGFFNGQTLDGFQTTDSPSPYGAYDMAGNVYEWTHSWYSGTSSDRVLRGGSWYVSTYHCQSWYRNYYNPYYTYDVIGFRVSRTTSQAE